MSSSLKWEPFVDLFSDLDIAHTLHKSAHISEGGVEIFL